MAGTFFMDILVPATLVYVYLANYLTYGKKQRRVDPREMKESMDTMMTNMLLPISFFLFCRKLLSQIVAEKESGMLEYLTMNGTGRLAYNLSIVLHETLISGPLICVTVDFLLWYKLPPKVVYTTYELLTFNFGMLLFMAGISAYALLISKAFKSAGFATQIGSLFYLVPILLSLYLKVLEMKHTFSNTFQDFSFGDMPTPKQQQ